VPRAATVTAGTVHIGFGKRAAYKPEIKLDNAMCFNVMTQCLSLYKLVWDLAFFYLTLAAACTFDYSLITSKALPDYRDYGVVFVCAFAVALLLLQTVLGPLYALVCVAHKWLLLGHCREGVKWAHRSRMHAQWITAFNFGMNVQGLLSLYLGTPVINFYFWLAGGKLGRNVTFDAFLPSPEADLITVGDNTYIGSSCGVYGHNFCHGHFKFEHIEIGKCCRIIARLQLVPNTVLADGVHVGPCTVVMPGEHQERCAKLFGNPARPCTRGAGGEWLTIAHGGGKDSQASTINCIEPTVGVKERDREHVRTLKLLKQSRPGYTGSESESSDEDDEDEDPLARPLLHDSRFE